jgi:hypothetical protein
MHRVPPMGPCFDRFGFADGCDPGSPMAAIRVRLSSADQPIASRWVPLLFLVLSLSMVPSKIWPRFHLPAYPGRSPPDGLGRLRRGGTGLTSGGGDHRSARS